MNNEQQEATKEIDTALNAIARHEIAIARYEAAQYSRGVMVTKERLMEEANREIKRRCVESETFVLTPPEPKEPQPDAESALQEIWAVIDPECEALDYRGIVSHIQSMQTMLEQSGMVNTSPTPGTFSR